MQRFFKRITLFFAAGCLGALAKSIIVWLFGEYGINQSLGVRIAPEFTLTWIYPRIVWGGLWGFLFALPLMRSRRWGRGIVISLVPSLIQLLVIMPYKQKIGMLGLSLGTLTPLVVCFFNAIWGLVTAIWIQYVRS